MKSTCVGILSIINKYNSEKSRKIKNIPRNTSGNFLQQLVLME